LAVLVLAHLLVQQDQMVAIQYLDHLQTDQQVLLAVVVVDQEVGAEP
jgi:hypothetical protein